jgi:hypothetical protein
MKFCITRTHATFYLIPTIRIWSERFYDGKFCNLAIEFVWLKWTADIVLIDN